MISPINKKLIEDASYDDLLDMRYQGTIYTINKMFRPKLDDEERQYLNDEIRKRVTPNS